MATIAESISARSWLFAPGDSERKMEKATAGPADIVLLDLEDAVTEDGKPQGADDDRGVPHGATRRRRAAAVGADQPAATARTRWPIWPR